MRGENEIKVFKTCIVKMQETPVYVFDAAFGSIKQESDLDVSVTSTDVLALEHWIDWIGKRKECMSRAWDTNFYYEKAL